MGVAYGVQRGKQMTALMRMKLSVRSNATFYVHTTETNNITEYLYIKRLMRDDNKRMTQIWNAFSK